MSVKDPQGTVSLGQGSQFVGLEARQEQYFSTSPNSPDVRRTIRVQLAGREVAAEVSHGVFSGNRLDLGTSVLLRRAPEAAGTHGDLLDLGCGWGPIALTLGLLCARGDGLGRGRQPACAGPDARQCAQPESGQYPRRRA
jgi:hypothetical protein